MVDGSGLENRQSESSRGFESHPLRRIADVTRLELFPARTLSSNGDSNAVRLAGRVTRRVKIPPSRDQTPEPKRSLG